MSNEKNKLFIGNLSWKADENDLRSLFEQHGEVVEVKVIVDNMTGRSRGFAFVTMGSDEGAQEAIAKLDGVPFQGRDLRVSVAEERRDSKPREPRKSFPRREGGREGGSGGFRGGDRDREYRGRGF